MRTSRAMRIALASATLAGLGAMTAAPAMATFATTDLAGSVAMASVTDALVDPAAETSLTLHKHLGAPIAGPSNGLPVAGIDLPVVQGVVFQVYRVMDVDLTTNAGWAAANALKDYRITQADIANGYLQVGETQYELDYDGTATTGADGQAVHETGVGLYLVNEDLEASTNIRVGGAQVPTSSVTPAAPFMVSLPMTHPTDQNAWMYDVHVYPKSTSDTITKTVQDEGTLIGSLVAGKSAYTYTIDTSVTPGLSAAQIGTYVVADQLDARVSLTDVTLTADDGTALAAGADYAVFVDDAAWDNEPAAGAKVEVSLTTAGIAKVITGGGLSTVLGVTADSMGSGTIFNEASFVPSASWWAAQTASDAPYSPAEDDATDPDRPLTSASVRSTFASLNLTNREAGTATGVAGATYEVWLDNNGDGTCTTADFAESYDPMYRGVTGAGGALTIGGLQASGFYDDVTVGEDGMNGYCIIGTGAADGYSLLAQPVYFEIDVQHGLQGGFSAIDRDLTLQVVPKNLANDLPLTGGAGLGLGLGALALIGGGGAYALRRRDANKAPANA